MTAATMEMAWNAHIKPWLQGWARWPSGTHCALLVPDAHTAAFLKAKAFRDGLGILGLTFWTPHILRSRLLEIVQRHKMLVSREDSSFLFSLFLETHYAHEPTLAAWAPDPTEPLVIGGRLQGASWNAKILRDSPLAAALSAFYGALSQSGVGTVQQLDSFFLETALKGQIPLQKSLLVVGFNPRHWELAALLKTAVHVTEDLLWVDIGHLPVSLQDTWGTYWSTYLGERKQFTPKSRQPIQEILADKHSILLANNVYEEAEAVVRQAIFFLAQSSCERLAIVLGSRQHPLASEIVLRFQQLGISFYDGIGRPASSPSKDSLLQAWLTWQAEGELGHWVDFIECLRNDGQIDAAEAKHVIETYENAFRVGLTGDTRVLSKLIQDSVIEAFLHKWPLLPEKGHWADFYPLLEDAFSRMGHEEALVGLKQKNKIGLVLEGWRYLVERKTLMRWLSSLLTKPLVSSEIHRSPWARLHLLAAEDAVLQNWTHLILAGLNQGYWPTIAKESLYLTEALAIELNSKVFQSLGAGQPASQSWLLSASEQQTLEKAYFYALLEQSIQHVTFTASLADPQNAEQDRPLSSLLSDFFFAARGKPMDAAVLREHLRVTADWIQGPLAQKPLKPEVEASIEQLAHVQRLRRDPRCPFGEYEFCFREPPVGGLMLSCKAWEELLERPGATWFRHILKVRKRIQPSKTNPAPTQVGTWVHDWICLKEGSFIPKPSVEQWKQAIDRRAHSLVQKLAAAYGVIGKRVPAGWSITLEGARRIAYGVAEKLGTVEEWPWVTSEIALPVGLQFLDEGVAFPLRGRIDLLFSQNTVAFDRTGHPLNTPTPLWIVDIKTGRDELLTLNRLAKGKGLQLALYGMAVACMGYDPIYLSIARSDKKLEPQVTFKDWLQAEKPWETLKQMQGRGIIGSHGLLRSDYSFAGDYPLATLAVDPVILSKKWNLTHPTFPVYS